MLGADYSWGRPSATALRTAGVQFVGRYAAAGRGGINISKAEADALRAAGINLYIFNEHQTSYMMGGRTSGVQAAQGALAVTRDAGISDGVIFFSADFEATLGQMATLGAFLDGAATVVGAAHVGIYGSHDVCAWVLDHTPYTHAVQCAAWSRGHWDPRIEIRQDRYNWSIAGTDCDGNTLIKDGGQFRLTQFPDPAPVVAHTADATASGVDVRALQTAVHAAADGVWGADTDRRVQAIRWLRTVLARSHPDLVHAAQQVLGVTADGVYGPATAAAWTRCVQAIQRALHIGADGLWGPATEAAYIAASPLR
jgi:Domain of unknown function (DUF1906)